MTDEKVSLPDGYDWHWPAMTREGLYHESYSVSVEELYQAFKARLMAELVASAERDSVIQHGRGDVREVSFHEFVDRPHES